MRRLALAICTLLACASTTRAAAQELNVLDLDDFVDPVTMESLIHQMGARRFFVAHGYVGGVSDYQSRAYSARERLAFARAAATVYSRRLQVNVKLTEFVALQNGQSNPFEFTAQVGRYFALGHSGNATRIQLSFHSREDSLDRTHPEISADLDLSHRLPLLPQNAVGGVLWAKDLYNGRDSWGVAYRMPLAHPSRGSTLRVGGAVEQIEKRLRNVFTTPPNRYKAQASLETFLLPGRDYRFYVTYAPSWVIADHRVNHEVGVYLDVGGVAKFF
ncbi:MAG TPA: hypothetical protein VJT67_03215 [Longimicrobiaceae bacterium]|nr:hypothetical protein [Longimicrobiaceae bacterium]